MTTPFEFTGECFVPGQTVKRLAQDHFARYRFAAKFVRGKRVLDIACGSGYGSRMLLDAGATEVTGVDLSADAVAYARSRYGCDGVTYLNDSIYSFGDDRPYDVVVSFETIEHVDNYRQALENLHRLLSLEGTLLISSPNRFVTSPNAKSLSDRPANPYHVQEFVCEELMASLWDTGFALARDDVFGQRCQPRIRNPILRKWYRKIMMPHRYSCPEVKPFRGQEPRYYVAVARKTSGRIFP